jgi:hypothetical protein
MGGELAGDVGKRAEVFTVRPLAGPRVRAGFRPSKPHPICSGIATVRRHSEIV